MIYPEHILNKNFILLFGQKVKKHRVIQGITQGQLAFECNIPRNQIGRIERGEINTTLKNINAIAKAFNIHPKELFEF